MMVISISKSFVHGIILFAVLFPAKIILRTTLEISVAYLGVLSNNTRAAKLRLLNFLSLFRDLQKSTRFSGGGGSSRIFRDLQEPTRFSGGGVVAGFFRDLQLRNLIFTRH